MQHQQTAATDLIPTNCTLGGTMLQTLEGQTCKGAFRTCRTHCFIDLQPFPGHVEVRPCLATHVNHEHDATIEKDNIIHLWLGIPCGISLQSTTRAFVMDACPPIARSYERPCAHENTLW